MNRQRGFCTACLGTCLLVVGFLPGSATALNWSIADLMNAQMPNVLVVNTGYVVDPAHGTTAGTTQTGIPVWLVQSEANGGESLRVPYLQIDQKYYGLRGVVTVYAHLMLVSGSSLTSCTQESGAALLSTGSSIALDSGAFIPITGGVNMHCTDQYCVLSFTTTTGNAACDGAVLSPERDILFRNSFEQDGNAIFKNGFEHP